MYIYRTITTSIEFGTVKRSEYSMFPSGLVDAIRALEALSTINGGGLGSLGQ